MVKKSDLFYTDRDVHTAALDRIARLYAANDEVWVSYSGGKDSLVCLKLCEEYLDSIGSDEKINVIFRDEEIIQHSIRDFVLKDVDNPRYNFHYLATPLHSEIYVLGKKYSYIQWDENREWVVPKPKCATKVDGVWRQEEFDKVWFTDPTKKVCCILGLRAGESLTRFMGITMSTVPYMTKSIVAKNVTMGKPIYDWSQNDVFKYFYDNDIEYCQVYDHQVFNRDEFRVASALHAEAAGNLDKLKTIDPLLWNQILDVFPEVDLQARYYKEIMRGNLTDMAFKYKEKAGCPWSAIYMYIDENITDKKMWNTAMERVTMAKRARLKNITQDNPFGGYPALYVFRKILAGGYKRSITPTPKQSDAYFEYENISRRT